MAIKFLRYYYYYLFIISIIVINVLKPAIYNSFK